MDIIRALLERIDIHPGAERGWCEVIIVGALAHILASTQQLSTGFPGGDDSTHLMIARACNWLYLLFVTSVSSKLIR